MSLALYPLHASIITSKMSSIKILRDNVDTFITYHTFYVCFVTDQERNTSKRSVTQCIQEQTTSTVPETGLFCFYY